MSEPAPKTATDGETPAESSEKVRNKGGRPRKVQPPESMSRADAIKILSSFHSADLKPADKLRAIELLAKLESWERDESTEALPRITFVIHLYPPPIDPAEPQKTADLT